MRWLQKIRPTNEPVGLDEALTHCNLATGNACAPEVAHYVQSLIAKSRNLIEQAENRQLITSTWEAYRDAFPLTNEPVEITGRLPLTNVDKIEYMTEGQYTEWDAALYQVDAIDVDKPGRILPVLGEVWPLADQAFNAVRFTLTCGYGDEPGDVPETARNAINYMVAQMYAVREPVTSMKLEKVPGDVMQACLDMLCWGDYR